MVGLLEQHSRQGSRPGGKLVDHSSWQGWAPNASPNSRPWSTGEHQSSRSGTSATARPARAVQNQPSGSGCEPLVWTSWGCLSCSLQACTDQAESPKSLGVQDAASRLPAAQLCRVRGHFLNCPQLIKFPSPRISSLDIIPRSNSPPETQHLCASTINTIKMSTAELATSYAALILADDGVEITVSLRPMHTMFWSLGGFWDWGTFRTRPRALCTHRYYSTCAQRPGQMTKYGRRGKWSGGTIMI